MTADDLIASLNLLPHPEGGAFRETYRAADSVPVRGGRSLATGIYFLLRAGQHSDWHRVESDELWLYHGGDPLRLRRVDAQGVFHDEGLGLGPGLAPQRLVPAGEWQSAHGSRGPAGWTLVSCMVVPGFDFADFTLATVEELAAEHPAIAARLAFPT